MRFTLTALTVLLLADLAPADAIIVRKGRRLDVVGMRDKIELDNGDKIEITPDNIGLYADQSDGVILVDSYNGIEIARNARSKKGTFYPSADIVKFVYSTEPTKLLDGLDDMRLGAWAQAIANFQDVVDDPEARQVFKEEANFRIGLCFYRSGNLRGCIAHYQGWRATNSKHTPQVQRILGQLYTGQKAFAKARARYAAIGKLPEITDNLKYLARLGDVEVDIAERKYSNAEQAAAAVARESRGKADARDAHIAAVTLQAEAIFKGGEADRLAAAQSLIEDAAKDLKRVEPATKARMYVTLGHVVYAQRKPGEARFPYLRAALMYEDTGAEGPGFTNAGLCYLDLAGKAANEGDQAKSDELFMSAMRLLGTAAGRYRDPAARKHYLKSENKERFDKLKAKAEAEEVSGKKAPEKGK